MCFKELHVFFACFCLVRACDFQGYPLYDSNTDFRFFWVHTKLMEADGPLETVSASNAFRIKV